MKKLNGTLNISFTSNGVHVTAWDASSGVLFLDIKLNPEQTCEALSYGGRSDCTMVVQGLEYIGKTDKKSMLALSKIPKPLW